MVKYSLHKFYITLSCTVYHKCLMNCWLMLVTITFTPTIRWPLIILLTCQKNTYRKYVQLCEFSGICSAAVEISVLLVCGAMLLGDWCLMFQGHQCLDMSHTNHPVTLCHIWEEQWPHLTLCAIKRPTPYKFWGDEWGKNFSFYIELNMVLVHVK